MPSGASHPSHALRQRLIACDVDDSMRLIYQAYGGIVGVPVAAVASDRIVQFAADMREALRAGLAGCIRDTRGDIVQVLDRLEQVFKCRDVLAYRPPSAGWGKRQPLSVRVHRELPSFLGAIAAWRGLLSGAGELEGMQFAALAGHCDRLQRMWRGAEELLPLLPVEFAATVSVGAPPAILSLWSGVTAVIEGLNHLLRRKHAQLTGSSGATAWQELAGALEGLPLARAKQVLEDFQSVDDAGAAVTASYDGFLGILADIGAALQEACDNDQAWAGMLDACTVPGDDVWWRARELRADAPAGQGVGELAPACVAMEELLGKSDLPGRLALHLPDEERRRALVDNGGLIRLGAIALVASRTTPARLSAWLKTSGQARSEHDRAIDRRTAPKQWRLLRAASRMYAITRQVEPVLLRLRTGGAGRMQRLAEFSLASKAFAFTKDGKFLTPARVHEQEVKFSAEQGWNVYLTNMKARSLTVGRALRMGIHMNAWPELWEPDAFGGGDIPHRRIDLARGEPAATPGQFGYACGYAFLKYVQHEAAKLPTDAQSLLMPLLTVPIRNQWWGKNSWLIGVPSIDELLWFMRWLAVMDPWFREAVFSPLCPPRPAGAGSR